MLKRFAALIVFLFLLFPAGLHAESVLPAPWPTWLAEAADISDPGLRIEVLSRPFLGIPYQADTLGGGTDLPEMLTVNFEAVDCFTLLDTVEALRRSSRPGQFRSHLIEVRYQDSKISWETRRHFFSDWGETSWLRDVSAEIGGTLARTTFKKLNLKSDGRKFLPGIAVKQRTITWLPSSTLDAAMLSKFRNGDYLGAYSEKDGLDVSHVGIVVRKQNRLDLRHASSRAGVMQVVDTPLVDYLADKPGIILLRPVLP